MMRNASGKNRDNTTWNFLRLCVKSERKEQGKLKMQKPCHRNMQKSRQRMNSLLFVSTLASKYSEAANINQAYTEEASHSTEKHFMLPRKTVSASSSLTFNGGYLHRCITVLQFKKCRSVDVLASAMLSTSTGSKKAV